jgi:hypothetical protein
MLTLKKQPTKVVKTAATPVATEAKRKPVALALGKIETGIAIPVQERGSIYDFGLSELTEGASRFIAPPEGFDIVTLNQALSNHISKERGHRNFTHNFIARDVEENGVEGVRVWCVKMEDKPMRGFKQMQEQKSA